MHAFLALLTFIAILFIVAGALIIRKAPQRQLSAEPIIETPQYPTQPLFIDTPFAENLSINEPLFPDTLCSIADFGAIGDGTTSNTIAFEKAIESCDQLGGGKVIVPAGVFLTGPIHLRSNINLHIERDATILFSPNPKEYLPVVFSRFEGIEYYNYSPPIYAKDATNIAITGVGTIRGQGALTWWKFTPKATKNINKLYAMGDDNVPVEERVFGTETDALRPSFIEFVSCNNVLIENVNIFNGPMWTIHPIYSNHIVIRGVNIVTSPGPSTDGIAIDSSSYVLIEDSTFSTGDDAIVLKSGRDRDGMRVHRPTENIVIRNNSIKDSHAAIAIGSEMSGDVRNVFVSDITINKSQFGFRIKASLGRGGIVENIWIQDMAMRNINIRAIQLTTSYGTPFRPTSTAIPIFRNIHVKNITAGKTAGSIEIIGLVEMPIRDISFENISLPSKYGIYIKHTDAIDFTNTNITLGKDRPLFTIVNSAHTSMNHVPCEEGLSTCLLVQGEKTENINIQGTMFKENTINISEEVRPDVIAQ